MEDDLKKQMEDNLKKMEDDLKKINLTTNQSTKINLIGIDTIVNPPSIIFLVYLPDICIFHTLYIIYPR
jgi:hypothetical protein